MGLEYNWGYKGGLNEAGILGISFNLALTWHTHNQRYDAPNSLLWPQFVSQPTELSVYYCPG